MHPVVYLCLAFLMHLSTILIITHQGTKHTLRKCIAHPWAWFGQPAQHQPHHKISRAQSVLLFVAICAVEDAVIPREFDEWFAILTTAAAIMIAFARFDVFLPDPLSVIINAAVIGLVSQSCASFAMRYAIRAVYVILLSYIVRHITDFYICKRELIARIYSASDLHDPNGIIAMKVREMW